ncbi:hypothetical protein [Oscillibacter sp. 1-3]|uniref:hypothetical protein n=1 Tax=Oscillibacter sp. 1-3 TaxID=1235797 RepID=UPI000339AE6F|nr:hypothetical protein [Oscillibacter sp. 1-3]EOS65383.1 hypothetical protein C816_02164 [Oscillibacter sp. 1-3]MCI9512527.1 hypothetical protein [Oscillibacter sp.]
MTLLEMSREYGASAEIIHARVVELRAMERAQTDGEAARRLRRRVAELMPMWREMRELAALTARYYERSYHKNEKYTL